VYLTLTVGVAKTTHYCMGRENSSAFFSFHADSCACFKLMGETSGCCKNESVLVQVDEDQSVSLQLILQPVQLPFIFEFEYSIIGVSEPFFHRTVSHEEFLRPPPLKAYLKNCSLIFYDEELLAQA